MLISIPHTVLYQTSVPYKVYLPWVWLQVQVSNAGRGGNPFKPGFSPLRWGPKFCLHQLVFCSWVVLYLRQKIAMKGPEKNVISFFANSIKNQLILFFSSHFHYSLTACYSSALITEQCLCMWYPQSYIVRKKRDLMGVKLLQTVLWQLKAQFISKWLVE